MAVKYLLAGMGVAAAILLSAKPEAQPPAPPTSNVPATTATVSSQEFADRAAITGLYEVQAARIARQRSHNPAIDRFASDMIRDHGMNNLTLRISAARIGLHVPTELDAQHAEQISELRSVGARQFNATYAQQQVQGHQDAVALFAGYARNGGSPTLKEYARSTLPVLQRHLGMAQALPAGPEMARNR